MTINGVNSVNFKGEQEKRSSGSLTLPILGTAAGGLVTGFTKFGKKELTLDSNLKSDVFAKATSKLENETDKENSKIVKNYLKEQETATATSTGAATKSTDDIAKEIEKAKADALKDVEYSTAEYQHAQEIQKVESENTQQIQKLYDEVLGANPREKAILESHEETRLNAQKKEYTRQLGDIKTKLEDKTVSDAQKESLKKQQTELEKKVEEVDAKLLEPKDLEKQRVEGIEKRLKTEATTAKEESDKTYKTFKEKYEAYEAKAKAITDAEKDLETAKTAKKEAAEIKSLQDKLDTLKSEQAILEKEKLSTYHQSKIAELKSDFAAAKVEHVNKGTLPTLHSEQTAKISLDGKSGSVVEEVKEAEKTAKSNYAVLNELNENTSKYTKLEEGFNKMMGTTAKSVEVKAGETTSKVAKEAPEYVTKAMEGLKGKLFKVSGAKIALGAGIGLVAGYVLKWIFGGKSEE